MKTAITSTDLTNILMSISTHVSSQIRNNGEYLNIVLSKLLTIKWDTEFAEKYGTDFREIVCMLRDYNEGKFRNVKESEISNIVTMLVFYTKPIHVHELSALANTKKIQNNIACRLISYYRQLDLGYTKCLAENNCMFGDIITVPKDLAWESGINTLEEGKFEMDTVNLGKVLVNDEERQLEHELSTGGMREEIEDFTLDDEGSWATSDNSWY